MGIFDDIFNPSWEQALLKKAKTEAAREGSQGRPAPDSTPYDSAETSYRAEASRLVIKANERVTRKLREWQPIIVERTQEIAGLVAKLDGLPPAAALRNEALTAYHEREQILQTKHENVLKSEGNVKAFKALHDITFAPDHPKNPIDKLADIFVLLVIEGALNAYWWRHQGEAGYAGGFLTAIAFAMANIGIGVLAGLGVRYFNRSEPWAKILASFSLLFGLFAIFTISLYVAVVRSTTLKDLASAFSNISQIFAQHDNMILFLIGMLFGIYAIWKGYHDVLGTVPGYKKRSEDFLEATRQYEATLTEIRENARTPIDRVIGTYKNANNILEDSATKISKLKADLKALVQDFNAIVQNVSKSLVVIIEFYRGTNVACRPTGIEAPRYFAEPAAINTEINDQVYVVSEDVERLENELESTSKQLRPKISEELKSLTEIRSIVLGDELTELINRTRSNAREKFLQEIGDTRPEAKLA